MHARNLKTKIDCISNILAYSTGVIKSNVYIEYGTNCRMKSLGNIQINLRAQYLITPALGTKTKNLVTSNFVGNYVRAPV